MRLEPRLAVAPPDPVVLRLQSAVPAGLGAHVDEPAVARLIAVAVESPVGRVAEADRGQVVRGRTQFVDFAHAIVIRIRPKTQSREQWIDQVAAFRKGLSETGYVEGRNLGIEYRFADKLLALADEVIE